MLKRGWMVVLLMLVGCGSRNAGPTSLAQRVEQAHGVDIWRGQQAIAADLVVELGGQRMLDAKMVHETNGIRSRIELADGTVMVFDGQRAWVSPASSEAQMARFHLLTWPYFVAAPFKLRDGGSHLTSLGTRTIQGKTYEAARLTFDPGIGDTPDDWYVIYGDPPSSRLAGMAYIVTYGTPREQAEQDPHAITFDEYVIVDGVTLAEAWQFWQWNEQQGIHGDPIGRAALRNIRFVEPDDSLFAKPADAREDALPRAEATTGPTR